MAPTSEQCPWCSSPITHERFVQIQKQIRAEEQRKLAADEKAMKEQLAAAEQQLRTRIEKEVTAKVSVDQQKIIADRKAIEAERAKLSDERRNLADRSKRQVEQAKHAAERQRQKELTEQRSVLTKDKDDALLKLNATFAREREGYQKKLLELNRKVEQKAGDVGDGAEVDLFEELRAEFPTDNITRVQKGKPGGDILHEVLHKNESCGTIIIDSKNRQAWNASFVKKLRQDQTDAGADHAILSTSVFPSGKKELCVESGVIVVAQARAVVIIDVLRKAMVSMHVAKLGKAERATKLSRLYEYVTSTDFTQKLSEVDGLTADALQLDVDEKRTHDNVWKKRGTLLTRIKHVLRDMDTEISAIIEARDSKSVAAMTARAVEH